MHHSQTTSNRTASGREQRPQATWFAVSVLAGAFCLGITNSLPEGWSGGAGFLAGFAATFVLGVLLRVAAAYHDAGRTPPYGAEPSAASGVEREVGMEEIDSRRSLAGGL